MESQTSVPDADKRKLEFEYDYQSRRIAKKVYLWSGSGYSPTPSVSLKFVYDGWNLIAILTSEFSLQTSFSWGLDINGSDQGAGGVGGLLAATLIGQGTHFIAYDGNGNVMALVSASGGTVTAQYEYSPFGEVLSATGSAAGANPMRFSTKYQDSETGLYYYGYRYYNPSTGRWLSRDPIEELGSRLLQVTTESPREQERVNLYGFCLNNPIMYVDKDGRVVPVIIIGGAILTAEEAAALAATIGAAICASDPACLQAVQNMIGSVVGAVSGAVDTLCKVRCRFGNHPPHHSWTRPRWGIPPWKQCWFNHIQINCWLQGVSGSNFLELRLPYGPCYKFQNAIPPTVH
jgi:RHS repeat-associated protein